MVIWGLSWGAWLLQIKKEKTHLIPRLGESWKREWFVLELE